MTDATCTCLEKKGNACKIFIQKNYIDWARRSKLHMHVIWEFAWSNSKIMDWLPFPRIVRCNKTKGRSLSSSAVMLTVEPVYVHTLWLTSSYEFGASECLRTRCWKSLKWYVSQALKNYVQLPFLDFSSQRRSLGQY